MVPRMASYCPMQKLEHPLFQPEHVATPVRDNPVKQQKRVENRVGLSEGESPAKKFLRHLQASAQQQQQQPESNSSAG